MQKDVSSPAILYMLGIISSRPCDAVKVVVSAPACSAPWTAPGGAAFRLHLDDLGDGAPDVLPPWADHSSAHSPMFEDGVIG